MKAHDLQLTIPRAREFRLPRRAVEFSRRVLCRTSNTLLAATSVLTMLVGAAWLITAPQLLPYLQALLWATGFVFAAMALEAHESTTAGLMLGTALALPPLAWMSSRLAPEFALPAVALLAIWLAVGILRHPPESAATLSGATEPTSGPR